MLACFIGAAMAICWRKACMAADGTRAAGTHGDSKSPRSESVHGGSTSLGYNRRVLEHGSVRKS
ncbi:hypothetical protein KC19_7G077300 [Ceratodon purpureus]|uniref:Secreted protein n=1 Tax=Ceratodon purpureus TaxID=3225 RepID=A0A8T0H5T3_CERPU|nr:hypothetical protein KC19_7G077300 [Ceratodon purpureus]